MFRISKEFHFSASHQLKDLPDDHPCARLHGHNYIVQVVLESDSLNQVGFVRDYRELSGLKDYIDDCLDHRHLNDVLGDDGVTAEQIAFSLYHWCRERWPETAAVRVSETPKTWAEYRPSPEGAEYRPRPEGAEYRPSPEGAEYRPSPEGGRNG